MLFSKLAKDGTRLALALILGLALLVCLTPTAQAEGEPIDLLLGGEGATSWNISNIKPGDSGTMTVTLHNAGYEDGFVTIWISDIVSSEGTNPESETGDTAEPGELIDYLMFNLSCSWLSTNLSLPVTIDKFPQSVSAPDYIKVSPLNAGDTVNLHWEWELPSQTGNDCQGDSLSLTINYLLEELPSGGRGGGGGDGSSFSEPQTLLLQVDMWGKVTSGERSEEGILLETIKAVSPDGMLILLLPQDTAVLDQVGNPLDLIEVKPVTVPKPLPGKVMIGLGYDLQPSCAFEPPIEFILYYDPQALSDGISEDGLVTAYYDQEQREWVEMPTLVDTEAHTATASISHSLTIAILAESPAVVEVAPFSASIRNLSITPYQVRMWGPLPFVVRTGEEVRIIADVVNSGYQEGNYSVSLKLNGHTKTTRDITLGPKQSKRVVFVLSGIQTGRYIVVMDGVSGEFTSSLWVNWWLIIGVIAALAVICWLTAWLYKRKSKNQSV